MTPRLSALLPSYNHAHYLESAVESVLAQAVEVPFELVIVDDGSRDGSRELLARYAEHPQVTLELRENHGISPTFNRCLELARGEWVGFCCSDDRWHPHHLQQAWESVRERPELSLSFGQARLLDRQDQVREDVRVFGELDREDPLAALLREGNSVCLIATLFRREWALEAGGFDNEVGVLQDYDLYLRLLQRGPATFREEASVDFRWDGENASGPRSWIQRRRDAVHVLTRALETFPRLREEPSLRAEVVRRLIRVHVRLARRLPDPAEARAELDAARRLGFSPSAAAWERIKRRLKGPRGQA